MYRNCLIALIGCTAKKEQKACRAAELYASPLFRHSFNYAKKIMKAERVYVLSAKHHLVDENEVLEPYNIVLSNKRSEGRKWAETVRNQLKDCCDMDTCRFLVLAGKKYYQYLARPSERIVWPGGTDGWPRWGIGKRLEYLKKRLDGLSQASDVQRA
jgi:hypothetical protein